ncbi:MULTISPECIES: hypothetical protein [Chitinophagaceae]
MRILCLLMLCEAMMSCHTQPQQYHTQNTTTTPTTSTTIDIDIYAAIASAKTYWRALGFQDTSNTMDHLGYKNRMH